MRLRLEQRDISTGHDTGLALRYQVKYVHKLRKHSNIDLILGAESFVDLRDTDWSGEAGLGQNRSLAGIGWQTARSFAIETGYMNQHVWRDGGEDQSNHFAVLNLKADF